MRVRIKNVLLAAGAGLALMAVADTAAAQCAGSCAPPPPPAPPPLPNPCAGGSCAPPVAPPCCGAGGSVNVNVNINNNQNTSSTTATARAYAGSAARSGATVIVAGGGGAYFNVDQPYPTTIQGLTVEGSTLQTVRVPFSESRRMEKRVRLQAVCIDDRARPHPASQVRPGKAVANDYEGELYRCIAGSKMQWTIVDMDGGPGETINCNKREALWHSGGGRLECRPEKQERDCNERSLLRRYGAGDKELVMVREEIFTAYREEVVQTQGVVAGGAMMMLDGGVGGRVF
jgi:hypothetical protein